LSTEHKKKLFDSPPTLFLFSFHFPREGRNERSGGGGSGWAAKECVCVGKSKKKKKKLRNKRNEKSVNPKIESAALSWPPWSSSSFRCRLLLLL
jgi:hypothetical protein